MKPSFAVPVSLAAVLALAGCGVVSTTQAPPSDGSASRPQPSTASQTRSVKLDPTQADRLRRMMPPLIQAMNHPVPLDKVRVGVMDDPHINAGNAGSAQFIVTTGLLQKANDDQLRAVLAHELAHEDLGHVAKTQNVGAGLELGSVLLDKVFPGVGGALGSVAGNLALNAYSRNEEYQADSHGAEILQRAGYDGKAMMVRTLSWLMETEGTSGGGFFANHPATGDRIARLQQGR
jgi:Zn-dependent protease with chaperone function